MQKFNLKLKIKEEGKGEPSLNFVIKEPRKKYSIGDEQWSEPITIEATPEKIEQVRIEQRMLQSKHGFKGQLISIVRPQKQTTKPDLSEGFVEVQFDGDPLEAIKYVEQKANGKYGINFILAMPFSGTTNILRMKESMLDKF